MRTMTSERLINRTSYSISRRWNLYTVREFCIRHQLYTRGDIEAYDSMLTYVNDHDEPDVIDIERVALDILDHSSSKINETFEIVDIMFLLTKECITTYFTKVMDTEAEMRRESEVKINDRL